MTCYGDLDDVLMVDVVWDFVLVVFEDCGWW